MAAAESGKQPAAVLVHGLWMKGFALALQARRLRRCGFRPYLYSYPTVRATLPENARRLARFAEGIDAPAIHFVGHSLGGLVVLQMLKDHPLRRPGRAVLLGSPYAACQAAAVLARRAPGRILLGRSMLPWLDADKPALDGRVETGVIAGCRSLGAARLISRLAGPNDGVVTVEETRVPGMRDHLVLPVAHSEMLVSAAVARQICAFLNTGRFLSGESLS